MFKIKKIKNKAFSVIGLVNAFLAYGKFISKNTYKVEFLNPITKQNITVYKGENNRKPLIKNINLLTFLSFMFAIVTTIPYLTFKGLFFLFGFIFYSQWDYFVSECMDSNDKVKFKYHTINLIVNTIFAIIGMISTVIFFINL